MGTPDGHADLEAWLVPEARALPTRVFGLTGEERLRRSLAACGVARVLCARDEGPGPPVAAQGLVLRADFVFDPRLVEALVGAADHLLCDDTPERRAVAAHARAARLPEVARRLAAGATAADAEALGLRPVGAAALAGGVLASLRKSAPPVLEPLAPERVAAIEERLYRAAYKGITDFVTRWLWPRPALAVTRWLARRGVRPNPVTLASWLLVGVATVAFARADFAVGLAAGWLMTFLDTVDGKLARVTLASSRLGHVLDHGLDLVHPPFWWAAFAFGLFGPEAWQSASAWIVVGGYLLGRALEGIFLLAFGIEIHSWRPLDSAFRSVTARRNPNLALLTVGVAAGRPEAGFAAVAAWTLLSNAFHAVRIAQAFGERSAGRRVGAWYDDTAASGAGA
jgi:phosphatidylglycerophosphate synthase